MAQLAQLGQFGLADTAQFLTFGIAGEIFAIPVMVVRDILEVLPVTEVPTARPFVSSLINVRGRVVPLVDLRVKLSMAPVKPTVDTRFVVIETEVDGEVTLVAFRADKVFEVAEVDFLVADEAPRIGMRWRPELIRAIGRRNNRFIMILDLTRIFSLTDTADF